MDIILDLDSRQSNADWIRASRLLDEGDEKSLEKFKEMDNTKMIPVEDLEE